MYTTTMNGFRIKQDEMLRQAENFRLIRAAQKRPFPASRLLSDLKIAINQLFSF